MINCDYSGTVSIFGNEIKDIEGYSLRQHILYLDQSPYIFDGTIRDNLTLGESFSAESIDLAIQNAGLVSTMESLPNGIDTTVSEAGDNLSGGEKQRLSIARGLLRNRHIILLDETTSNLDEKMALEIEETLLTNLDLTVIMITHHLHSSVEEYLEDIINF